MFDVAALRAQITPERVLGVLATEEPGVETIDALLGWADCELAEEPRLSMLRAWERVAAWVAAQQQQALAAVAGPAPADPREDWAREEVAAALRISPAAADRRLTVARRLAGPLAATAAALASAELTMAHVYALVEETYRLDEAAIRTVESVVLAQARLLPPGRFRRLVRRAVVEADPLRAQLEHDAARPGRGVDHYELPDGMAGLGVTLTAPEAAEVYAALDAAAKAAAAAGPEPGRGEPDSIEERRADVLVGWARAASGAPAGPRPQAGRPEVRLTIDLPTLLGFADQPGELAGYGPIPPSLARLLAADGQWRRFVTDPVIGVLLDYGRTRYTPPPELADFVAGRDGTCRFPGCPRAAERCDLDHVEPWAGGGVTSAANLAALCRRHHRLKTHTGWRYRLETDCSCTWTSPTGERYRTPARPAGRDP